MYATILLAAVCLLLSFQLGILLLPPTLVNVGDESDQAYVSNFHQREGNEWSSFRWTKTRSYFTFRGAGYLPVTFTLTLNGWRPENEEAPEVQLLVSGREFARFTADKKLATYEFRYIPPPIALHKDLFLEIRSDTFTPPSDEAGRTLGVLVDAVRWAPITAPVWSSHLLVLALLSSTTGLAYLILRLLAAKVLASFTTTLLLLALACAVIVFYPLETFLLTTLSFACCSVAYGSLLASDKLRQSITALPRTAVARYRRLARSLRLSSQVVALALVCALGTNLATTLPSMIEELTFAATHPHLSYAEKMRLQWGVFYDHITFVRDHTAADALIAFVPWQDNISWIPNAAGDVHLMQYFLYPRRVTTLADEKGRRQLTHVYLVRTRSYVEEADLEPWPQFYVPVKSVSYMPQRRQVLVDDFVMHQGAQTVVLEDFEDSTTFAEWALQARRVISKTTIAAAPPGKANQAFHLDLAYTQSDYDYWGKSVDLPLSKGTWVQATVRSNLEQRVNIVIGVLFDDGHLAVLGSPANQEADAWETLKIDKIHDRARDFGLSKGWDVRGMRMTMIGVNPGHPAPMPYVEGWGVLEIVRSPEDLTVRAGPQVENGPYHFSLGQAYEGAGRLAEASAEYRQAILLEPGDARFQLALGEVLRSQGEMEEAMAAYMQAIALAPEIAWPHFGLAELWLHTGEHDLALAEYEQALAISPNLSEARFALAGLYEEKGLLHRAYAHYLVLSRFLYDPYHRAASEAMQRIEEQ
ncbi:MAG: tetratricopeptide repeat protein [Anaerolineae bacterium]